MINKILTLSIILLLAGCDATSSDDSSELKDVNMIKSVAYEVFPGNKVVKNVDDTIIRVTHTDGEDSSIIVLQEGNATIIRKP